MDEQQMINAIASSSNSFSTGSAKKYDAFLSFRGEDTRRNFTSHLYEALRQNKVETYIDDRLQKGDEISLALIKAIEDSHVSIVVFSENYASSKWCLGELSKILECKKGQGQIVIPVFYNIDPSHVRKQTGKCGQAFAKHEGELRHNKWKAALTEVANLAGWDSQTYRTESKLLKDIVGDVLRKLTPRYPNQLKGLVGIEENYLQIESILKIGSSEVRILGIWGMGGIGKTAIATALYEKLSHEFEGGCFLANVREESDKHGLKALCNKLFSEVLENENHYFDVSQFVLSRLRRKKVCIVLDDVATSEQLENLIVDYDFLGPGSRVIVTTRNKQIFSQVDEIYEVKKLSFNHSLQLFCLTVFRENEPKHGYEDLSRSAISYCKGIPLALKALGASLRSRSKEAWESELRKVQKIPNMEIHNVLKLSYDGLDRAQKDIFLDIACFFKQWHRDRLTSLLEACDFFAASGIEVLLDKALITISNDNRIEMHDLIQEMGREIVHQESIKDPGRRSRLWKHEEVHDVLKYNKGTDVVEGIILDVQKLTGDLCLDSDSFAKMSNLRFLQIHGLYVSNRVYLPNGLESLPDKLRYLEWYSCCLESLPSNFCAEQLVELHMPHSKLKKLWDGVQNLVNLKTINLFWSEDLIETPDLSKAEKLESVSLSRCESLRQLHPSMLSAPNLKYLDLSYCIEIESLNIHSKSLYKLDVNGCSSLKEISVTSEKMMRLSLYGTAICVLSSSIGHLLSLEELGLRGSNVESLPANIKNLSMLRTLWLENCRKLVSLPELPPFLECMDASNCTSLDTDFTQRLVLQHMLQSHIPYLHKHHPSKRNTKYFMFPGDHITESECGFHTAESSITIHDLPISHLCGFICCVILSRGPPLFDRYILCSIYQGGTKVGSDHMSVFDINLISDHVLFWYHDIRKFETISKACDYFSNITFIFEFEDCYFSTKFEDDYDNKVEIDRGCAVFPVYASELGLKLFGNSSKEDFQFKSTTQISDIDDSQPRAIGVRRSNNENEDEWEVGTT